ncbi:MAG: DUF1501 domain-containing protein [Verrucomicrobiales bacterium]|nr:DUF1501 domain-containing protein [Verrucomicrobiales bacterium]
MKFNKHFSRRQFAEYAAKSFLGVSAGSSLPGFLGANEKGLIDNSMLPGFGRAKNCIYLFMSGGMSHLDTFDPKPGREEMGATGTVKSNVPGEPLADNLPMLAKHRDKLAVVKSLGQKTGDHQQGSYFMRTSYSARPDIRHPSLGPWAQTLLGKKEGTLPDSVSLMPGSGHPGRGFLPASTAPLPILRPDKGVPHSQKFGYGNEENKEILYNRRLDLLDELDSGFRAKFTDPKVKDYTALYDEALAFMKSKDLEVFDLSKEPGPVRNRYGDSSFAQGCLLAKRLVKAGVRFVDVQKGGWDTHDDNFNRVGELAADMDRSVANLLSDLAAEGLLESTLVVIATEFGRGPVVNANTGRDHHPRCFSCVLAGGGIAGGGSIGKSDEKGDAPADNPLKPADFNATIAHAMGMDLNKVVQSMSGRPFTVAAHTSLPDGTIVTKGHPIAGLF